MYKSYKFLCRRIPLAQLPSIPLHPLSKVRISDKIETPLERVSGQNRILIFSFLIDFCDDVFRELDTGEWVSTIKLQSHLRLHATVRRCPKLVEYHDGS